MSDKAEENKLASPEEVNIIKEYNTFAREIPWNDLKSLPEKLAPLKKWANLVGIKDPGVIDKLDLYTPVKDVVVFIGVLVKRLHNAEKELAELRALVKPPEGDKAEG